MGGKSGGSRSESTVTNTDKRIAAQDSNVVQDSSVGNLDLNFGRVGGNVSVNSTDAVVAISQLGADALRSVGGAVVDLTAYSVSRNLDSLDNTVTRTTALTDSLIAQSYANSQAAISQANATANSAIASADAQVRDARTASSRLTADTLQGAQAIIQQQTDANTQLQNTNARNGQTLSELAIKAYTPGDNKASDNVTKIAIAGVVGAVAFIAFKGSK